MRKQGPWALFLHPLPQASSPAGPSGVSVRGRVMNGLACIACMHQLLHDFTLKRRHAYMCTCCSAPACVCMRDMAYFTPHS